MHRPFHRWVTLLRILMTSPALRVLMPALQAVGEKLSVVKDPTKYEDIQPWIASAYHSWFEAGQIPYEATPAGLRSCESNLGGSISVATFLPCIQLGSAGASGTRPGA